MSESTRTMLHEQLLNTRENLGELWARMDLADVRDFESDPREELEESVLEIVWEKGEPFAVVLGTGGPHIEIRGGTRHDGMTYRLVGYWAGEKVELWDLIDGPNEPIRRTGEYFRELVEESGE